MNQAAVAANTPTVQKQVRAKVSNSASTVMSKKAADSETEFPAEFVIGALLYSLFSSGWSEAVISVLNEEKRG